MGFLEKKMHLVDINSLSILFQAKSGVLHVVWIYSLLVTANKDWRSKIVKESVGHH